MTSNTLQIPFRTKTCNFLRLFLLFFIFIFWNHIAHAQGLNGVVVEKIPVTAAALADDPNLSANAIAYRVFVESDTNFELQAVMAIFTKTVFGTTTKFYNNADFGATTGKEILSSMFASHPASAFDSYITINAAANNKLGVLFAEDTLDGVKDGLFAGSALALQSIGVDFEIPFGTEDYEGDFSFIDGGYNVLGGEKGPTSSNRVLIGQFTTDGDFSFEINVQIRQTDSFLGNVEQFVARDPVGLEYHHSSLHYPGPAVQIISPLDGEVVPTNRDLNINVTANAVFGLKHVEFFVNDAKLSRDSISPYTAAWTPSAGTVRLMAVVMDSLGAADTSDVIEISTGSVLAPTVSITSPVTTDVISVNQSVTITVNATDTDGTIALVEFYANDAKIGEDSSTPFSINWTPEAPGSVALHAVATDNDGAKGTSPDVVVSIGQTFINDVNQQDMFSVYPNPAENTVTLYIKELTQDEAYRLDVIDAQGNILINKSVKNVNLNGMNTLDISKLSQGIYLIRISTSEGRSMYCKLIK